MRYYGAGQEWMNPTTEGTTTDGGASDLDDAESVYYVAQRWKGVKCEGGRCSDECLDAARLTLEAIRAYAKKAYQRGFEDGKMGASNNAGA